MNHLLVSADGTHGASQIETRRRRPLACLQLQQMYIFNAFPSFRVVLKHITLAIKALKNYPSRIKNYAEARSVRGVGEKTARKAIEVSINLNYNVQLTFVHQRLKRFYKLANSVVLVMRGQMM